MPLLASFHCTCAKELVCLLSVCTVGLWVRNSVLVGVCRSRWPATVCMHTSVSTTASLRSTILVQESLVTHARCNNAKGINRIVNELPGSLHVNKNLLDTSRDIDCGLVDAISSIVRCDVPPLLSKLPYCATHSPSSSVTTSGLQFAGIVLSHIQQIDLTHLEYSYLRVPSCRAQPLLHCHHPH